MAKRVKKNAKVPNKRLQPNLRFKEFMDEWNRRRLEEVAEVSSGGTPSRNNDSYWNGDIPWVSTTLIDFNLITDTEKKITEEGLRNSSAKLFTKGSLLMAMYGQGKTRGKVAMLGIDATTNQACASIMANREILDSSFLFQNLSKRYHEIRDLSNKGGQENLSGTIIKGIEISFPSLIEQKRIADFFSFINERILTQNKIIEGLKSFKVSLRNRLFEPIPNRENEALQIKDILEYEQPTKYLVSNTNYSPDSSFTPVLTANKAFVLGYTDEGFGIYNKGECIIFDDFTMDMKYVDFPFKVKSSAIKILTPKPNVNLKFIFEYLTFLDLRAGGHKRHYISEIEPKIIALPDINKQNNTAKILSIIDQKIEIETTILNLFTKQKQYLLQQMFI
ncbi:MAG: restriction endonuclease subunit S [Agriterribacter sp.]